MEIKCESDGFDFTVFDNGQTFAHVHIHDRSTVDAKHFPPSERCHEFVSVQIEAPALNDGDGSSVVHMNLDLPDARRLVEAIQAALVAAEDGGRAA